MPEFDIVSRYNDSINELVNISEDADNEKFLDTIINSQSNTKAKNNTNNRNKLNSYDVHECNNNGEVVMVLPVIDLDNGGMNSEDYDFHDIQI